MGESSVPCAHRRLRCLSAQLRNNRAAPQASWSFKKRRPALSTTDIVDLEVSADDAELTAKAAAIYHAHGCCVIRGLNGRWVEPILDAVARTVAQSRRLQEQGKLERVDEGWITPDGTLFIPAAHDGTATEANRHLPVRDLVAELGDTPGVPLQVMVPAVDYQSSSALFQCACDERVLDIVSAIFGSPNIELFGNGQLVFKEPGGGHAVNFHQDAAFFEFGGSGLSPIGTLNYCVDTDLGLNNGPLTVFPGTHRAGFIDHVDTSSHLGLDPAVWTVEDGVTVEGRAGDSILFHQHTVHGSTPNHSPDPRATFINRYTKPEDGVIMPLATSVEMRAAALELANEETPARERGIMVRGDRVFDDSHWDLGSKAKGQFH